MRVKLFGKERILFEDAKPDVKKEPAKENPATRPDMQAWGAGGAGTRQSRLIWRYYDGEKTAGGMGPITRYTVDHDALRMRSWQALLESEIVQIAVNRSITWGVGKGMKLRLQPDKDYLASKGIKIDPQKLSKQAESIWKMYSNTSISAYSDMENFHQIVWESEKNAIMGGDCLWIVNIVDGLPKVEIKDGSHVRTPIFTSGISIMNMTNPTTGNRIRHGIEIDAKGEHIAFYVNKGNSINNTLVDYLQYERVPAKDEYGNTRAFMYYGIRYRRDDLRGIPLISVCMETTKQLEQYKEATVQTAVERAKVAFTIEHELGAIGTNPFEGNLARGFGMPLSINSDIPVDINGQHLADTFAATTGKQAINMPVGAKVKNQGLTPDIKFKDFYDPMLAIVFAALEIPYEVAMMMFGSNYSASRAAIKDWEHTLEVRRQMRIQGPYQKVFDVFFLCSILTGELQAPGYLEAFQKKNRYVMIAYTTAKWMGDRVPNIDELKEVKATRELLGAGSEHMTLITIEDAIERHSGGEFDDVTTQYSEELDKGEELGLDRVEINKETLLTPDGDPLIEKKEVKPMAKPAKKKDEK